MHEITALLKEWSNGDEEALNRLQPLVDKELKRIARNYMRGERPDHLLQPTALVHEALIRLIQENIQWNDRNHFYGFVHRRMSQILINYAEKTRAAKRDWGEQVNLTDANAQPLQKAGEILKLQEALKDLDHLNSLQATIVRYHFLVGLDFQEIAMVLELSERTVRRKWRSARAWLVEYMTAS